MLAVGRLVCLSLSDQSRGFVFFVFGFFSFLFFFCCSLNRQLNGDDQSFSFLSLSSFRWFVDVGKALPTDLVCSCSRRWLFSSAFLSFVFCPVKLQRRRGAQHQPSSAQLFRFGRLFLCRVSFCLSLSFCLFSFRL